MELYEWKIRIYSKSLLDDWIRDYLGEVEISHNHDGTSLMNGDLPDMPAVYGLILRLRDAGISLLSLQVRRKTIREGENND